MPNNVPPQYQAIAGQLHVLEGSRSALQNLLSHAASSQKSDLANQIKDLNTAIANKTRELWACIDENTLPPQGTHFAVARFTANGSLDPAFSGGIVRTHFGGLAGPGVMDWPEWYEVVIAAALDANGRILVAGPSEEYYYGAASPNERKILSRTAVARYQPNGTLDSSFSGNGKQLFDVDKYPVQAIAVAPTGKIVMVLAGGGLTCLNPNGSLDSNFGQGGTATTAFANVNFSHHDQWAFKIGPDGEILLGLLNQGLLRFKPDGQPDTTFNAGKVRTNLFEGGPQRVGSHPSIVTEEKIQAVALDTHGRVLVAGGARTVEDGVASAGFRPALARFKPNGTADLTFSRDGRVFTDFWNLVGHSSVGVFSTLAIDGEKVLAAGTVFLDGAFHLGLARFNSDGTLDATFGDSGMVTTPNWAWSSNYSSPYYGVANPSALSVLGNGDIMVAGIVWEQKAIQWSRYKTNGALDTSLNPTGAVWLPFPSGFDQSDISHPLLIDTNGRILVCGMAPHPK
jgi:uncharacterized delta-60 repeat protein